MVQISVMFALPPRQRECQRRCLRPCQQKTPVFHPPTCQRRCLRPCQQKTPVFHPPTCQRQRPRPCQQKTPVFHPPTCQRQCPRQCQRRTPVFHPPKRQRKTRLFHRQMCLPLNQLRAACQRKTVLTDSFVTTLMMTLETVTTAVMLTANMLPRISRLVVKITL